MTDFSNNYAGKPDDFKIVSFCADKVMGRINRFAPEKVKLPANRNGVQVRGTSAHEGDRLDPDWIKDDRCADLSPLASFDPFLVGSIRLNDCQFDDFQLKHILHCSNLRTLDFSNSSVSEFGLFLIRGMKSLNTLILNGTATTDVGLSYLTELPLRNFYFKRTEITDAGLVALRAMPSVVYVSLSTNITGDGLAVLSDLAMETLDLSKCARLSNDDLIHLSKLPKLKNLDLPSQIDDAVIEPLRALNLQRLSFPPQTNTTESGRALMQSGGVASKVSIVNIA